MQVASCGLADGPCAPAVLRLMVAEKGPRVLREAAAALLLALGAVPSLGCSLIGTDGLTGGHVGGDADPGGRDDASPPEGSANPPEADPPGADAAGGSADADPPPVEAGGPGLDDAGGDVDDASAADAAGGGTPETGPVDTGAPDTVTVSLIPTKDSYVMDGADADTNFGTIDPLIVKSSPTTGFNRNSWTGFDTKGYSNITSATLRLYVDSLQTTATNTIPLLVYYPPDSSQGWGETTITWDNAPPAGTDVVATLDVNNPVIKTWIAFDVTTAVAADTSGTPTFMITSTVATNREAFFSSREGANPPVLEITGTPP
jgi:hypothetical protein